MPGNPIQLDRHVLLDLCSIAEEDEHVDSEVVDYLLLASTAFAKFRTMGDSSLAHGIPSLTAALARLPRFNPQHLPFGYSGPTVVSKNWVDQQDVERIAKGMLGLTFPDRRAEDVAVAVDAAVTESVALGFIETQRYDAWRPGMASGSGWRQAFRPLAYGLSKAKSFCTPPKSAVAPVTSAPSNTSNSPTSAVTGIKERTAEELEAAKRAFKEECHRLRNEIGDAAEAERRRADVAGLLRQLIKEIELWTRELKHETFVLFEDSEHGVFARSLTGGGPEGLLMPGYIVIDFMLAPWVDDLIELSLTEQQVKSFRERMRVFNARREEFAFAVTKLAAVWDSSHPDYNAFASIDEQRKALKLSALDLCQYIDTLAVIAASHRRSPSQGVESASAQTDGGTLSSSSVPPPVVDSVIDDHLADANECLMGLADARRNCDIMSSASNRMEGGGEDWHFASRADESNYGDASQRCKAIFKSIVPRLNSLLAWGRSRGLEIQMDATELLDAKVSRHRGDDCEAFEIDVRTVMNALIIEKAKMELAKPGLHPPRRDPQAVWASAESIKVIAFGLLGHSMMIQLNKPSEYDDREKMSRDAKLAKKHGYLVVSVARQLGLDPSPLIRVLREDRLWEYPAEKSDGELFKAVADLAERVSTEARIWCAEAGIDPESQFVDIAATPSKASSDSPSNSVTRGGFDDANVLPVRLGARGAPCFVLGRKKPPLTSAQFDVVSALQGAGEAGLTKDALEAIAPSARRILRELREADGDWARVIQMAGRTNVGYRIRRTVHE